MINPIVASGIMTGNSLDGADVVATRYQSDGSQKDLAAFSLKTPERLKEGLRWIREKIKEAHGDVSIVAQKFAQGVSPEKFNFEQISAAPPCKLQFCNILKLFWNPVPSSVSITFAILEEPLIKLMVPVPIFPIIGLGQPQGAPKLWSFSDAINPLPVSISK